LFYKVTFSYLYSRETNHIIMDNESEITMDIRSTTLNLISYLFGIIFFAIGVVNTFWGNDPGFGIFVVLLSLVFFPPFTTKFNQITGFKIPRIAKILLGLFILWAALGVGELFFKIDMMLEDMS
jgi:hypothetical protein